jgi:hypothetical protein
MMRKALAILVLALAIPGAALAASTSSKTARKVMYVLKGTLSDYTAASNAANGSITIHVSEANYHGRLLRGKDLTFAISAKTITTLNGNATISNGAHGVVKFRALRRMTNAALLVALRPDHMRAYQVIDLGRYQPGS